jgi:fluoride ion exporter CrcB/FEX
MKEGAIAAVPSVTVPVIWSVLGYSFPTGSMIVGLLACFMVSLFITLDAPRAETMDP